MKTRLVSSTLLLVVSALGIAAQTSWLDRPLGRNWNVGDGIVPQAPRTLVPIDARCRDQVREPDSLADRAVTRAGWSLYGPSQTFGAVTVVTAMAGVDGMCRPTEFNGFVFVQNRFAGTLAPEPMAARSDGALSEIYLISQSDLRAEFVRYRRDDPLCCPSQKSTVTYRIGRGPRVTLDARTVDTTANCQTDGPIRTQDNVVSGNVTYRQRIALPRNAVLIVRLVEVTRQGTVSEIVAQERIDIGERQVPIPFDMAYDPRRIEERGEYVVQAEIREGDRLLFTTETNYPVITRGNPRVVDVTVVPVGGGRVPRESEIRGTVTYRQRIALGPNSEVIVRLVDSADPTGRPVAETTIPVGNRQVPIPFELPFEMRDINRQRNYELQAEIRTDGRPRFRTEAGRPVVPRAGQMLDVELLVVPASDGPEPITGRELNISRLSAGTMQIEGRGTMILFRASVVVRTSGDADVTLGRLDGSTTFSGKVIYFDSNTVRIAVTSSGNANASGEFEIRYTGRTLNSLTARDLTLDGQNVIVRF